MMNETRKTMIFAGAAVVLCAVALFSTPRQVTPDAFTDQGEAFFPDFDDPNAAKTLEVIEWDEETGTPIPFKVTFERGLWTIPSHHGYPADGADRLAETAAGVMGILKDDFRTANPADHEACGVVDPIDEANPSLKGRGQRVTIKGDNDVVLADFIIGKSFEGRDGFRLVRVPGQKRVYGVRMDIDISTKFSDWIETDLMHIEQDEIERVVLKDYSIDERSGRLNQRDEIELTKLDDGNWLSPGIAADKEVDRIKMSTLVRSVDELSIVGVRPKPEGVSASLSRLTQGAPITTAEMVALQSKGFFFANDGRLVSNEGELEVRASDGVTYTLRFGEVAFGKGLEVSAGDPGSEDQTEGENRYLMITASFNREQFPEPALPDDLEFEDKPDSVWTEDDYRNKGIKAAHDRWKTSVENGMKRSQELNTRFAKWFYVISAESFDKLHLRRDDVLKDKTG